MWYLAVILALVIVLATAGLIQVLWLEFAFIVDGTLPPHEGFADESSKNRQQAVLAHLDASMSDDGSEGFPAQARIAPHTLQNVGRCQVGDNSR
jgi:hypothetical protein